MAELLRVIVKDKEGKPVVIECSGIERYGDNIAFSNRDQDLLKKEGKVIEYPATSLSSVYPNPKKK